MSNDICEPLLLTKTGYVWEHQNSMRSEEIAAEQVPTPMCPPTPTFPCMSQCMESLPLEMIDANPQNWKQTISDYCGFQYFTFLNGVSFKACGLADDDLIEWTTKLMEDICFFLFLLFKDRSLSGLFVACTAFAKSRHQRSALVATFMESLMEMSKCVVSEPQPQSSIDDARSFFEHYKNLKDSFVVDKVRQLCYFALSHCLLDRAGITFNKLNYSRSEALALKKLHGSKLNFVENLIELTLFTCQQGVQVMQTGSISCLYHSPETYKAFGAEAELLLRQSKCLTNPSPHGFTVEDYTKRLRETLETGRSIQKQNKYLSPMEKRVVSQTVLDLSLAEDDLLTKNDARQMRQAPFGVLVCGKSSIGKSSLVQIIAIYLAKIMKLPVGPEYIYQRTPTEAYWNGFTSEMHTWVGDDAGFMRPEIAKAGDPSVMELIQILNNIPFSPDQACLEDKGRTPFRAKIAIVTTNTHDLNTSFYYSYPAAAQRRLPIVITPYVKKKYQKKDPKGPPDGTLDSAKVPHDDAYPDYWMFDIELVLTPPPTSKAKVATYKKIACQVNLRYLLTFLKEKAREHVDAQQAMLGSMCTMQNEDLTECCELPKQLCQCQPARNARPQSAMEYVGYAAVLLMVPQFLLALFKIFALQRLYFRVTSWSESVSGFATRIRKCSPRDILTSPITRLRAYLNDISAQRSDPEFWSRMGSRVRTGVGHPLFLISIAGVMTYIYKVYRTRVLMGDAQSSSPEDKPDSVSAPTPTVIKEIAVKPVSPPDLTPFESDDSRPHAHATERDNVWRTTEFDLSTIEISNASRCLMGQEQTLIEKIRRNTYSMSFIIGDHMASTNALCLGGNIFIANLHAFEKMGYGVDVVFRTRPKTAGVTPAVNFRLLKSRMKKFPERDIVAFEMLSLPPHKKLGDYFIAPTFNAICNGEMYALDKEDRPHEIHLKAVKRQCAHSAVLKKKLDLLIGTAKNEVTREGMCGSALLLHTPQGPAIGGIHTLGNGDQAMSVVVDTEFVSQVMAEFSPFVVQSSAVQLDSDDIPYVLGPLHPKSAARFIEHGTLDVYGSQVGFRPRPKSRVRESIGAPFLREHGYIDMHTRPKLSGWKPWHTNLAEITNPPYKFDENIVEAAALGYFNDIRPHLTAEMMMHLKPLTIKEAINGISSVAYLDPVKKNTSMGHPWRRQKTKFVVPLPPDENGDEPFEFTEEVMERIANRDAAYRKGFRTNPIFVASPKDEPVTFEKAEKGKTRLFSGAPVDFTVCMRKYFMPLIRLMQNNKLLFESAVGTVCQSAEWTELYEYITQYGLDRIIAGDFSKFDKRMAALFIKWAFRILCLFAEVSGNYSHEDLLAMHAIADDVAHAWTDFNGDLIQMMGTNPSGQALTVIINGLVNSLYARYVYILNEPNHDVSTFRNNIAYLTYGDDNIMGVNEDCDFFNHTIFRDGLAGIDIGYTMADKNAESVPFIHISQASFLKRTWRYEPDIEGYTCPLEHDSINKMLMINVRSKNVVPEVQYASVLDSAAREYFYYGREVFEEKRALLLELIEHLDLAQYMSGELPTYQLLIDAWKDNSKRLGY